MSVRVQIRNDEEINWITANPVLAKGEIGISTDINNFKVGDRGHQLE